MNFQNKCDQKISVITITVMLCVVLNTWYVTEVWAVSINVDKNCIDSDTSTALCDDGLTYRTIQGAINAGSSGDVIQISPGTYTLQSNIALDKQLTIKGAGSGTNNQKDTIIDLDNNRIVLSKGGVSDSSRTSLTDMRIIDGAGDAISITSNEYFLIDNVSFLENRGTVIKTASPAYEPDIVIKNSFFKNNGVISNSSPGDMKFFEFEGNLEIEKVEIIKDNVGGSSGTNSYGIEMRGHTCVTASSTVPDPDSPSVSGTVLLTDVVISGSPNKVGLLIQCYSDISGITLNGVDLSEVNAGWNALAVAHTNSNNFDIGDTMLPDLSVWDSGGIDATMATFVNTTNNFEIEDVVDHAVDGPIGRGLATWVSSNLFVTGGSGSISNALDAASSGDTINVAAGIYSIDSTITVDKPVLLLGAQKNTDPRPSSNTQRSLGNTDESIIDGGKNIDKIFLVESSNVEINGFEIKSGTGDLIKSEQGTIKSNPIIRYNIIHDSTGDEGVQLKSTDNAVVEFNHIYDTEGDGINIAVSHNGTIQNNEVHDINSPDAGIYVYNDGQRDFIDITIQNNLVYYIHNNDGIKVGSKGGQDVLLRGGTISGNTVHDTRQDGITVYSSNVIVDGNEIFNSASENGAIYISWNVDDITVINNNIHDNEISNDSGSPIDDPLTTYGVRVGKNTLFPTNVLINNNIISGNEGGIFYNFQQGNESLNATKNYWGSSKGPTHASNPDGAGDTIDDNVLFDPWYLNSKLKVLSSDKTGNAIKATENDVQLDSNGGQQGKATLPEDVEVIVLGNNKALDLATNTSTATENEDGDITIAGNAKKLKTFTSGALNNVDLKESKTIGDKQIQVKKAVKLTSGVASKPIKIKSQELPEVEVSIPDESTILAPESWSGKIQPPKKTSASGKAPSGFSVGGTVIEVGSESDVLLFDNPVDILLTGVTGDVGYKPSGSNNWVHITERCTGTFDIPGQPEFPGECFISNDTDTKIVTFHFTSFGSLTKDTEDSGGDSGDQTRPVLESLTISSGSRPYSFVDLGQHYSEPLEFQTGESINISMSIYENTGPMFMQHVALYTDFQEPFSWHNSELYIEWDKGNPLIIKDDKDIFKHVNATYSIVDNMFEFTFSIIFEKPMKSSDVTLYFWDYKRNPVFVELDDLITVRGVQKESKDITKSKVIEKPSDKAKHIQASIPTWIKNNTGWWADGKVDDETFVNGIEYLVGKKVIIVQTERLPDQTSELRERQVPQNIPEWIKNSAKWWSEDLVSDEEFLNALKWMIENNIIKI